jgi:hypothetical protein
VIQVLEIVQQLVERTWERRLAGIEGRYELDRRNPD